MGAIFAPSLMCMDLLKVQEQIEILNQRCDMYHVDIMDGHFVKILSLSVDFVRSLRSVTGLPIDCHLMVMQPEQYIDDLIAAGAGYISLHTETINGQAFRLIDKIKNAGCKFGIVLNPETEITESRAYLHYADLVTIMSIDPGFAGQKFIPEMLGKIREAKERKDRHGYSYTIAVDGACNEKTFKLLKDAGAECFIVGSSGLFGLDEDLEEVMTTFAAQTA